MKEMRFRQIGNRMRMMLKFIGSDGPLANASASCETTRGYRKDRKELVKIQTGGGGGGGAAASTRIRSTRKYKRTRRGIVVYVWLEKNGKRCRDGNPKKFCGVGFHLVWLLFWDSIPTWL